MISGVHLRRWKQPEPARFLKKEQVSGSTGNRRGGPSSISSRNESGEENNLVLTTDARMEIDDREKSQDSQGQFRRGQTCPVEPLDSTSGQSSSCSTDPPQSLGRRGGMNTSNSWRYSPQGTAVSLPKNREVKREQTGP